MKADLPEGLFEALLFSAEGPIPRERFLELLQEEEIPPEEAEGILDGFLERFPRRVDGGTIVVEVAGGYQLCTRPELHDWIRRLRTRKETIRLSRAAMETLAIVAYKQPVITPEIERIRGVRSGPVLRTLMERGLIRVLGRMDVPGKPLMYGTTEQFLLHFGLRDLASLPTLTEIQDLYGADEIAQVGGDDAPPALSE